MPHLVVLPFVLPILAGALLMALADRPAARRAVATVATLLGLGVALALLGPAAAGPVTYQLGDWPWPYGISMVVDRLSATMLVLAATVGAIALVPGAFHDDRRHRYILALSQFQLAGINGAFLAGDLFNLFVCFEVLLISSYALMVQGHARVPRSGLTYTVVNLTGSALFLVGIALLYGATGSLNLAHLAAALPAMTPDVAAMGHAGAWLVALVFALKAALLPLGLWLPGAYGIAGPTAVALFALLTKVGVYALLRVVVPWFAGDIPELAALAGVLRAAALATIALGALLALASRTLRALAGALVLGSVATALLAASVGGGEAVAAALFYLVHSTLAAVAVLLVAAAIARLRGEAQDRLGTAPAVAMRGPAMLLFLAVAVIVTGLPPLSGFLGKVAVLQLLAAAPGAPGAIGVLLGASLVTILAVTRAGNAVFLRSPAVAAAAPPGDGARPAWWGAALAVALSVAMTLGAGPLHEWTRAAGADAARGSVAPHAPHPAPPPAATAFRGGE